MSRIPDMFLLSLGCEYHLLLRFFVYGNLIEDSFFALHVPFLDFVRYIVFVVQQCIEFCMIFPLQCLITLIKVYNHKDCIHYFIFT